MRFDIVRTWYSRRQHPLTWVLLPFSWLFYLIVKIRRLFYQIGVFKRRRFNVPVIIVGNITVGGTGKTPFVIWLVELLRAQGYRPGIVSRGVGGRRHDEPYIVTKEDSAQEVGDEAMLFARRAGCPVVIGINRAKVVETLLARFSCDIVISDDGLQHYRLDRDIEIAIVDGARRFGNRRMLPAGPLRESLGRLKKVDFVVINGGDVRDEFAMSLEQAGLVSLKDPNHKINLAELYNKTVHGVAGIGHPKRFFRTLRKAGVRVVQHPFPDHYSFKPGDLKFTENLPIVMTEKDAVKCFDFAKDNMWYLKVDVKVDDKLEQKLIAKLEEVRYAV